MSQWQDSTRTEFALQWQNVGPGAPQWRYWDANQSENARWVAFSTPIPDCLAGDTWHTLVLTGHTLDDMVHYTGFTIDGTVHALDLAVAPFSDPGVPDKLAVAVQLDGNSTQTPYEMIIDQVDFTHDPGPPPPAGCYPAEHDPARVICTSE